MGSLQETKILPIDANSVALRDLDITKLATELSGWDLIHVDGEARLQKKYQFKDFGQALAFTNQVGALAEKENHHPSILTEWGKVTVTWWTHKVHGLHQNDFVMAARTDDLFERK